MQVIDRLFERYDTVYWSQSASNHPGLKAYYERMGMRYLGSDRVPNFWPQDTGPQTGKALHLNRSIQLPDSNPKFT